jgi:hypothetical protein
MAVTWADFDDPGQKGPGTGGGVPTVPDPSAGGVGSVVSAAAKLQGYQQYAGYTGDPRADPKAYFQYLTGKRPPKPSELLIVERFLNNAGIKVLKNAKGIAGKIQLADGTIVDVIQGADSGGVAWTWQTGTGGGEGEAGGSALDPANPYFHDFEEKFAAPAAYVPDQFAFDPFAAPTMDQVQNEPGYALGLKQGQGALEHSAAARGSYFTPNTFQGLSQFATDYAGSKYNDALTREAGLYSLNEGTAKSIFDTNTANALTASNQAYQNAWNEYLGRFNIFNTNQAATFNRDATISAQGITAASAGGA